jgi:P4 family phage/plasmid primase-like protien
VTTDPLVKAAQEYTERGWAVMLLAVDGKGGKIPPANCAKCNWKSPEYERHLAADCGHLLCHGFYAATQDFQRFLDMLTELPNGQLAIRTGRASRLLVVDAEAYSSEEDAPTGLEVLDEWEQWSGGWSLPVTLASKSVQGGVHLYYRIPEDADVGSGRVLPGVDVKCENGYVGAVSGLTAREWVDPSVAVADVSEAMLLWLTKTKRLSTQGHGTGGGGAAMAKPDGYDYKQFLAEGCPDGYRDFFFNDLLFRLRKQGREIQEAEDIAYHEWERAAQPPMARYEMPWDDVAYKLGRVWAQVQPDEETPAMAWAKTVMSQAQDKLEHAALVPGAGTGAEGGGTAGGSGAGIVPSFRVGELEPPDHWYGTHDDGTAARIHAIWGDWFRAIPRTRGGYAWICFNGCTWEQDSRDRVWEAVGHVVEQVQGELERWEARCMALAAERVEMLLAQGMDEEMAVATAETENQADWRTRRVTGRGAAAGEFEVVAGMRKYASAMKEVARKETGLKTFARLSGITIAEEDLDGSSRLLGLRDGRVLDVGAVHAGKGVSDWVLTPEPDMLLTKQLGCGFVPADVGVPGTLFEFSHFSRYLKMVLPDAQVQATIQEIVGYALLGEPTEKMIVLLHGPPDSGKTVLLEILEALFGDYGGWTDGQALIAGKAKSAHSEWLHKMRGLRVVLTPETAKGAKIDAAWMKSFTGREPQSTRGAYGDKTVVWKPQGIIWNASNHYLEYDAEDTAVAERTQVIEFERQFPRGHVDRDDRLPEKIKSELPIVLNWALAGLARHGAREVPGVQVADKVREWSLRYQKEQDHVGQFVQDALEEGYLCELDEQQLTQVYDSHFVTKKVVYALYKSWCGYQARKELGRNTFNSHLERVYGWVGVKSGEWRWKGRTCSAGSDISAEIVRW